MNAGRIESVRIRGFRSLADVELSGLQNANVLIGANGSGKSNFVRFFEMMSWMLRSRRLAEFVGLQGGADDQLFGGNRVTPRMEAELALRTEAGRNDYRFALAHAHPDRFVFTEEAFRFSGTDRQTGAWWQHAPSGQSEAAIVDVAQALPTPGVDPTTARGIVRLLKSCSVFQFHDTSDTSNFKKRWDVEDNNYLRMFGVNYFCRLASTISAGSGSSWIEINNNNIDPVGGVGGAERRPKRGGKRAGSTEHAGTASGRVFHAAGTIHRGARIGDGPRAHDVDRRRARGNNGPGVRPRGAGAGGDFRRDRSVR